MFFDQFIKFLNQYAHIDQPITAALQHRVIISRFTKRQIVLQPGQICKNLYYVHKGFFRIFEHTEAGERTIDFATAGEFITIPHSFFHQELSNYGIICETDAYSLAISYHDLRALEEQLDGFLTLSNRITTALLIRFFDDLNVYRTGNASERYRYLLDTYPQITNMVAQKDIASYLGLSQQTLSRLVRDYIK